MRSLESEMVHADSLCSAERSDVLGSLQCENANDRLTKLSLFQHESYLDGL